MIRRLRAIGGNVPNDLGKIVLGERAPLNPHGGSCPQRPRR
jgi:hypothetical protein